nr:sulfotransferase [Sphingosinithalassobacter tenebrarum]
MAKAAAAPTGTIETALAHAERLLRAEPELARAQAEAILEAHPDNGEALVLKGRALAASGATDDAIDALLQATRRLPDDAAAWRALADQYLVAGDEKRADAAQSQAIRASVHEPELRRAATALCANDLSTAERILKPWLKQRPTDVAAIRMLAELAGRIGRYRDAESLLSRAIELAPGFAPARFNMATLQYRRGRIPEAVEQLEALLESDPENPGYRNLLAAALTRIGEVDQALVHFRKALDRQPGLTKVWLSYGHALKTAGQQAESIAAYRRCIAQEPGFGEAWWSLANLKTVRLDEADVAAMRDALDTAKLRDEDRWHLHFALGKALEDAAEYEAAFGHYAEGNRLRLAATPYDPEATRNRVDRTISRFTQDFFVEHAGQGHPAPDPIFVLGMPRSGSTLVEQILASHPLVEGTHELADIQMMAARLGGQGDAYPENLATLTPGQLAELGAEYIERTRIQRHTDRPFFIDKMPNNWLHAGFIQLILPKAKIVDTRRNPLDCCFSNFKQHFARGQAFAYDLAHMGRYYADYVRLMAHFDTVAPGAVHRVFHEALIADPESEIRSLLAALDLPFDSACLRFHETDRAVRTASSEQVRRPINRQGVDQWRHFDAWMGPLKAELGRLVDDYPIET